MSDQKRKFNYDESADQVLGMGEIKWTQGGAYYNAKREFVCADESAPAPLKARKKKKTPASRVKPKSSVGADSTLGFPSAQETQRQMQKENAKAENAERLAG